MQWKNNPFDILSTKMIKVTMILLPACQWNELTHPANDSSMVGRTQEQRETATDLGGILLLREDG